MKKRVNVAELRFGMYVAELDKPWTETPFTFQGFVLRSDQQIAILREHCKHVFVDTERSDPGVMGPSEAGAALKPATEEDPVAIETEYSRASAVYQESAAIVEEMFRAAQTGKVLEGRRLRNAVSSMTDCILRNRDALLLVSRLKDKGGYTLSHSLDVSIYMVVFGRFLQLPRPELEMLGLLGLLQDIGKVNLPNELLEKTTPLTAPELELVKSHVEHSTRQLRATPDLPAGLAELAGLHHERHDGTGYPKGLKGPQIPLYGSLAAIVDTFDALTKSRPYAREISPSNALGILHKGRGTLFHEALVEQFIQCIGIFPIGSVVELNTGEIGVVIAQNVVRRLKPRVLVVLDAKGVPLQPQKILNLLKDPMATPTEPYRIRRTLEHTRLHVDPSEFFL